MLFEKFNYKIFPERKLIIRYYRGSFSIPDFILSMEETGKDSFYDPTFNVINDFRDAVSTVKIGEINEFFGYIKGHKILYGKRKSVFLTKTPNQTVFSMRMGLLKHENLIGFKSVSTMVEALKWVELPISDLNIIDNTIQDLKKAF